MSRTIIDLGGGRRLQSMFDWWADDLRDPEVRARKAQARAESMWTRPMQEARGTLEILRDASRAEQQPLSFEARR